MSTTVMILYVSITTEFNKLGDIFPAVKIPNLISFSHSAP